VPDDVDRQRAALAAQVIELIAGTAGAAQPQATLYGLVCAYSLGELRSYTYPLYEVSRDDLLAAGEGPRALWDPSWAKQLPEGVEPELPDRDLNVELSDDPELVEKFDRYLGEPPESNHAYEAIERLWLDVAAGLTGLDWRRRGVAITGDFVALAYPDDPRDEDIRRTLRHSLGAQRYREFESRGWIPLA
jgi:hypothetical protein